MFHNVEYLLTVAAGSDETLCVEVEQKVDGARWRGDFTARYVEDITAKTGNYKKYPVFAKMLAQAVSEESDSVFVDLLTYNVRGPLSGCIPTSAYIVEKIQGFEREIQGFEAEGAESLTAPQAMFF